MIYANDIKTYRESHDCSMQEARIAVNKRDRIERLEDISTDLDINGSANMYEALQGLVGLMLERENGN